MMPFQSWSCQWSKRKIPVMELFCYSISATTKMKRHIKLMQGVSLSNVCVGQRTVGFVTLAMLLCWELPDLCWSKRQHFLGVGGRILFIYLFHVCQHPAAWDRSAVTHSSATQVRGYPGAGLDKLDCAGIPSGPFKGGRKRNSGGMFLQSVGLPVKHSVILQNRSCCSFMPESLVFYDCDERERLKRNGVGCWGIH